VTRPGSGASVPPGFLPVGRGERLQERTEGKRKKVRYRRRELQPAVTGRTGINSEGFDERLYAGPHLDGIGRSGDNRRSPGLPCARSDGWTWLGPPPTEGGGAPNPRSLNSSRRRNLFHKQSRRRCRPSAKRPRRRHRSRSGAGGRRCTRRRAEGFHGVRLGWCHWQGAIAATPAGSRRRARREVDKSQGMMREVQPCAQFTRARQYGLAPDPPESPALLCRILLPVFPGPGEFYIVYSSRSPEGGWEFPRVHLMFRYEKPVECHSVHPPDGELSPLGHLGRSGTCTSTARKSLLVSGSRRAPTALLFDGKRRCLASLPSKTDPWITNRSTRPFDNPFPAGFADARSKG
jgi:hypothetical protein